MTADDSGRVGERADQRPDRRAPEPGERARGLLRGRPEAHGRFGAKTIAPAAMPAIGALDARVVAEQADQVAHLRRSRDAGAGDGAGRLRPRERIGRSQHRGCHLRGARVRGLVAARDRPDGRRHGCQADSQQNRCTGTSSQRASLGRVGRIRCMSPTGDAKKLARVRSAVYKNANFLAHVTRLTCQPPPASTAGPTDLQTYRPPDRPRTRSAG